MFSEGSSEGLSVSGKEGKKEAFRFERALMVRRGLQSEKGGKDRYLRVIVRVKIALL